MYFPTLFPISMVDSLQPRLVIVRLHKYALHLLKYCDQRFGKHPRFRYFILNIIMRHQIQGTTNVFVKRNIEYEIPTTIQDLRKELNEFPDTKLAE